MTTQTPPSDWELLSAFLDNQLSEHDRSGLEARLGREPELRKALLEMRRVRAILRSQPRLRAPRNFVLTPQMAGVRQGRRSLSLPTAFPVLRLASFLATLLLVLFSASGWYLQRYAPHSQVVAMQDSGRSAPDQPEWQTSYAAQEPETAEPETAVLTEEPDQPVSQPASPYAGAGAAAPTSPYPEPDAPQVAMAPVQNAAPEPQLPEQTALEQPVFKAVPVDGFEQPSMPERRPVTYNLGWILLATVQVLLGGLALVTGLAAWWMWYNARR